MKFLVCAKTINVNKKNFEIYEPAIHSVTINPENLWSELEEMPNTSFPKLRHMFKYFTDISVYNERTKERFIRLDKKNSKKISVNGCPRLTDFITNKKYYKKPRNILFLPFDIRRGIPKIKQNKNLNFK